MENQEQKENEKQKKNIGPKLQQIGINLLALGAVTLLAFVAWQHFFPEPESTTISANTTTTDVSAQIPEEVIPQSNYSIQLDGFATPPPSETNGVFRRINYRTTIPTRARVDVITYTVQKGDTLFSIAAAYGLKPETILWGNYDVLEDNPRIISTGQVLNILPVNGIYYKWKEGDRLDDIAARFKAEPRDIINYPGNYIDLTASADENYGIEPDTWIIIPGGKRKIKDWGPPAITRDNPAVAKYYGEGSCGAVYSGAYGTGSFVWPTTERFISGYNYDPVVHAAIDIGGPEGNPIYATDSGVVVYAGWSSYGYGNLIVIDHGNGWQSAYAHLSSVAVTCGQSVYQGTFIGGLGTTGNSSGPHLHFELIYNGVKVNPWDYLQ